MSADAKDYCYEGEKTFTLVKWKVRSGSQLFNNSVILNYKHDTENNLEAKEPLLKYKSTVGGTVLQLVATEGDVISSGTCLLQFEPCTHPVIMKDLCAECGTDLRDLDGDKFEKLTAATTFSMVHVVPELKVSLEQAEKLGRDDEDRLLKNKKLVLLVDLDQTLIHTTNDNVPPNLKDVYHFQLYGQYSPWYHTKFRPGTQKFLDDISKYYELHICTFGARLYAHKIAQLLDPDGKLFSHRILSRDECFDATSKTGNLKALFPRGDSMVCIIDDREDVWNFAPNVIHVKPYCFFRNTGDINAPPGFRSEAPPEEQQPQEQSEDGTPTLVEAKESPEANEKQEAIEKREAMEKQEAIEKQEAKEKQEAIEKQEAKEIQEAKDMQEAKEKQEAREKKMGVKGRKEGRQSEGRKRLLEERKRRAEAKEKQAAVVKERQTEVKEEHTGELEEAPDADDYLLYLEEILVTVHKAYYDIYDQMVIQEERKIPDLKTVVPYVRQKVLKGVNLVFSSLIPTNCAPENSRLWTLAISMGANVSRELDFDEGPNRTTHIVASKLGTAKLNAARREEGIQVVSLDWLLCCAERWERADERLFPLRCTTDVPGRKRSGGAGGRNRRKAVSQQQQEQDDFSERIFVEAGLSLSKEEIDDMDREVEEACSAEESEDSSTVETKDEEDEDEDESLSDDDYPRCWKKKRRKGDYEEEVVAEDRTEGEGTNSSDAETIGSVDDEMAAAVEREFQSY